MNQEKSTTVIKDKSNGFAGEERAEMKARVRSTEVEHRKRAWAIRRLVRPGISIKTED